MSPLAGQNLTKLTFGKLNLILIQKFVIMSRY